MSQVGRALDLLGQATKPAAPARLRAGHEPQLEVAWGSFHQGIGSSLIAVFSRSNVPKRFLRGGFFRDSWIERRIPRRALVAAALWHFVFIVMPFPQLPAAPPHYPAFEKTELTWSGPIDDFPLVEMKSPKAKPTPRGEPVQPLPTASHDPFPTRHGIFNFAMGIDM